MAGVLTVFLSLSGCGPASDADKVDPETGFLILTPPPPVGQPVATIAAAANSGDDSQRASDPRQAVLALRPMGFWPIDDGEGSIIRDHSGRDNHARANNLTWRDGLIDFTSGFQWLEIPLHGEYRAAHSFSMGGWYFSRRNDYLGGSNLQGGQRNELGHGHTQGVNLFGNAYDGRGSWVFWGARDLRDGIALRLRAQGVNIYQGDSLLDVVHANRADALNSAHNGVRLDAGRWHHVFYTHDTGRSVLYVDGGIVAEQRGVSVAAFNRPFLVGNDMTWWMLHPQGSQSFHGSMRDLVLFDRALSADEVANLVQQTTPAQNPLQAEDGVAFKEWQVFLPSLPAGSPVEAVRDYLQAFASAPPATLSAAADSLTTVLSDWIGSARHAPELIALLQQMQGMPGIDALRRQFEDQQVANLLERTELSRADQARAILGLTGAGVNSQAFLQWLRDALEATPATMPKVEDFYRNALLRALFVLDRDSEATRRVLGTAFAQPVLEGVDLSAPEWIPVRMQMENGRWMDALDSYRAMNPEELRHRSFSEGDAYRDGRANLAPNQRAYSPQVIDRGITYRVGSGVPWRSAKRIDPASFREAVQLLPEAYREAALNWEFANSNHLFRVEIFKEFPDGRSESALLEGPWFMFEGHDEKMQGWTIDIDSEGYLHLLGGMHNTPISRYYPPGVWEKMGFNRTDNPPALMYWVSKRPFDISEFEFVGGRDNPRKPPVAGMNYMNFLRDRDNNMFLYGRISAQATQSWGMFRYNAGDRRWYTIGGDAVDVINEVRRENTPDPLILRTGQPWQPITPRNDETVFVWSWHPHFYNYIRAWGARFDPSGRMHVRMRIRGLTENNRITDSQVYAWSDDLGQSWHRADGTRLRLPLTINPASSHNADLRLHETERLWNLWLSLLSEAGYSMEEPDPLKF